MEPLIKLVHAILLSAHKKGATEIWVRREGEQRVVSFRLDGEWWEEMVLPPELHGAVVRRLGIMASLPMYRKDAYAEGAIVLRVSETREIAFDIRVRGHGDSLEALLRSSTDTATQ